MSIKPLPKLTLEKTPETVKDQKPLEPWQIAAIDLVDAVRKEIESGDVSGAAASADDLLDALVGYDDDFDDDDDDDDEYDDDEDDSGTDDDDDD